VRRAFHTLKGSGRMVGATDISEFAWAIENLLNKDHREHAAALAGHPGHGARCGGGRRRTREYARGRQAAPARTQDIIDRAHALAANRSPRRRAPRSKASSARSIPAASSRSRRPSRADPAGRRPAAPHRPHAAAARAPRSGCSTSRRESGGEEIVLSTPDEESSADLQLREIYSRETQVNIDAVLRYVEARGRTAPHVGQRRSLSRLPHARGQLAHGRGAAWHPSHRAARTLGAQVLRQRRGPWKMPTWTCSTNA
jgi:chemotaxis protein histidine kinase CheA